MELGRILSDFHEVGQEYKEDIGRLDEAGIARLIDWMTKFPCGTITAFRNSREEDDPVKPGEPYTRKEKLQRNVQLLAQLQDFRYKVISVRGGFIENYDTPEAVPVHENTFFVVDYANMGTLEANLRRLGEIWNQDSVLFLPQGGEKAILWGTSKKNHFPEYGTSVEFSTLKAGYKNATQPDPENPGKQIKVPGYNRPDPEFFTKKGNLPFFFESIYREHTLTDSVNGRWGTHTFAIRPWQNITEEYFYLVTDKGLDE